MADEEQNTVGYGSYFPREQLIRDLRAGAAELQDARAANAHKDAALAVLDKLEAIATGQPRTVVVNGLAPQRDNAWVLTIHADRLEKEKAKEAEPKPDYPAWQIRRNEDRTGVDVRLGGARWAELSRKEAEDLATALIGCAAVLRKLAEDHQS